MLRLALASIVLITALVAFAPTAAAEEWGVSCDPSGSMTLVGDCEIRRPNLWDCLTPPVEVREILDEITP